MSVGNRDKSAAIYHLILEQATNVDHLLRTLEEKAPVQIWITDGSTIRVGRLPRLFKAIPISEISYDDGWIIMHTHEHAFPMKHIYVVCEAKDAPPVEEKLKEAAATISGLRVLREA